MILLAIILALWLATVPLWTLLFYWALMHVDKAEHEGWASKEAVWIARKVLLPIGAVNNLTCAWTWAAWHYRAAPFRRHELRFAALGREWALSLLLPHPGVTKFTNAMVANGTPEQAAKGMRIRRLYLNNYDRRGVHD